MLTHLGKSLLLDGPWFPHPFCGVGERELITFSVLVAPLGLQDLSSLTRDRTWALAVKALSPNHWEFLELITFKSMILCFHVSRSFPISPFVHGLFPEQPILGEEQTTVVKESSNLEISQKVSALAYNFFMTSIEPCPHR